MHRLLKCTGLLLILSFLYAGIICGQEDIKGENKEWYQEGRLDITETGMIESVLLPGLHLAADPISAADYTLDLTLTGPDGKNRPFELFWTEKGDAKRITLETSSLKLDNRKRLIWEGMIPENFIVRKIILDIPDKNYIGRVDIHGLTFAGWRTLAGDIAIIKTTDKMKTEVQIPAGEYRSMRLYFSGYDQGFKEIPAFIGQVEIEGEISQNGYAEEIIRPAVDTAPDDRSAEIKLTLPGSGIRVDMVQVTTGSVFQGKWQLGWETIHMGEQTFQEIKRGENTITADENRSLAIDLGIPSKNERMVIKLNSMDYFGEIQEARVYARLPRLLFFADQKGTYTLKTGLGKRNRIREMVSGHPAANTHMVNITDLSTNPLWQPDNMPRGISLKGGPFRGDGYTWKSPLRIDRPGYYRLILSDSAGLEDNRQGLRIIKNNEQIPYFFSSKEKRKISISKDFEYDKKTNRSIMPLSLPGVSNQFTDIMFTGKGIFKREINIEYKEPGKTGWQKWIRREWISKSERESSLYIGIHELPRYRNSMRIVIDHGDNQPVLPESIDAVYQSQDLFFIASEAGEYEVVGGNPKAAPASYDISIIQNYLFNRVPQKIRMGETVSFKGKGWQDRVNGIFSETGWGLYGVLGLVTLGLLIIIVRLFPRKG